MATDELLRARVDHRLRQVSLPTASTREHDEVRSVTRGRDRCQRRWGCRTLVVHRSDLPRRPMRRVHRHHPDLVRWRSHHCRSVEPTGRRVPAPARSNADSSQQLRGSGAVRTIVSGCRILLSTAISPSISCASPKPPPWPRAAGWAGATRKGPTVPPSTPCASCSGPCPWTASSSSARARRTKPRCSTTASTSATAPRRPPTSPWTRSTAPRSPRSAAATPSP